MGHAELRRCGSLKPGDRIPQDELPGIEHPGQGFEEFLPQGLVLPLQIQHGDGLDRGLSRRWEDGIVHLPMLSAGCRDEPHVKKHSMRAASDEQRPELKTFVIPYIVVTLRDSAAAGLPLRLPVVLFLSTFSRSKRI